MNDSIRGLRQEMYSAWLRYVAAVGGRDVGDRLGCGCLGGLGHVAVLGVPDRQPQVGAVSALEAVERALELDRCRPARRSRGCWVCSTFGRIPARVRVVGEAAGGEQRRDARPRNAARAGRARRAAARAAAAAAQRPVVRVHAVQRAQERQRLHPAEHSPNGCRTRAARARRTGSCRGRGRSGAAPPGGVDQPPVQPGAVLDRQVARHALRGEAGAVVRLVPDRPERDRGEIVGVPGRGAPGVRVVVSAVARAQSTDEGLNSLAEGIPVGMGLVPRRTGAGGPQRRAAADVEVDR